VGIAAIGVYLLVALPLVGTYRMAALVLANSVQHTFHAVVMLILLQRRLGGLTGGGMRTMVPRIVVAALAMGLFVYVVAALLPTLQPGLLDNVLAVVVPGLAGLGSYGLFVTLLRIEEAQQIVRVFMRRFGSG
jgi:peptidoglycan biosynthesis protein MviN/MurJ (putative lipid II flippase)